MSVKSFIHEPWASRLLLLLIIAVGAFFRINDLNQCALHMDNQDFLNVCRSGLDFTQIFTNWSKLGAGQNHLPFPPAWTSSFLKWFHLELTFGHLILPSAIWGVLVIPVAFMIGRDLRGNRLGLSFASLIALHPIYIQFARLAYYYSPAILGSLLLMWSVVLLLKETNTGKFTAGFYFIHAASIFLMIYSDSMTWPHAAIAMIICIIILGRQALAKKHWVGDLVGLMVLYLFLGMPVLFSSWGFGNVYGHTIGASPIEAAYWKQVFWNVKSPWPQIWPVLYSYAWGTTPVRIIFSSLAALLGLIGFLKLHKKNRALSVLMILMVISLVATVLALRRTAVGFSHARICMSMPILLLLLAWGMTSFFENSGRMFKFKKIIAIGFLTMGLGLHVYPAYLSMIQSGRPKPYKLGVAWLDDHLPVGTPILTERFFDAFNEYRIHPATNVIFMSTVGNQTAEEYVGNGFRQRSEYFLSNNPVSGVVQTRLLWTHPQVGPWKWPERFYARRVAITNEPGLILHRLGLSDQTEPFRQDHEEAYMCTYLYNLPEDVVAKAKRDGKDILVLLGQGWKYIKTKDYRDWRVLFDQASILVYNLTETTQNVSLVVKGVAADGAKSLRIERGKTVVIPDKQLSDTRIELGPLMPGTTEILFTDALWPAKQSILLVEKIDLELVSNEQKEALDLK